MNALLKIGKYLFALPLLGFVSGHFTSADAMAGMVPIPGGAIWVYLTGLAMLAFIVSVFVGKFDKLAGTLLGIMILIFALGLHLPNLMGGDQNSMGMLIKDLMIAGGAFMYAGAYARDNSVIG